MLHPMSTVESKCHMIFRSVSVVFVKDQDMWEVTGCERKFEQTVSESITCIKF